MQLVTAIVRRDQFGPYATFRALDSDREQGFHPLQAGRPLDVADSDLAPALFEIPGVVAVEFPEVRGPVVPTIGVKATHLRGDVAHYRTENHGSVYLVRPLSGSFCEWLQGTAPEDAQWWCGALVVEPRYVAGVISAATEAGF